MANWSRRGATYLRTRAARLWRLFVFAFGAWALALVGGVAALVLVVPGVLLLPLGLGALALSGWRWALHAVAAGQRALGRRMLGTATPPLKVVPLGPPGPSRWRGAVRRRRQLLGSQQLWRETGYQYLAFLVLLPSATVVLAPVLAALVGAVLLVSSAVKIVPARQEVMGEILIGAAILGTPLAFAAEVGARRLLEWALGPSARYRLEERVATLERARRIAVAAAEDERRRLERDLHDGAQAGMVAVAVQLGLAADALQNRRVEAHEAVAMVQEARRLSLQAIDQVRSLARGLHPSVLSARGLAAALAGLVAEAPVAVSLSCEDDLGPMSREAETAAYFCVAELLANVYKHSGASSATVSLTRRDDTLVATVADDGTGGAVVQPGGGLQGLVDRLAALDGRLDITGLTGRGTAVRVTIPALCPGPDQAAAAGR